MPNKKSTKTGGADTLLVELLTEELPPKSLKRLSEDFANSIAQGLRARGLMESASPTVFATPRRLAVRIASVLVKGKDEPVEQKLMPLSVARTPDGKASDALRKKLTGLGRQQLADRFPNANDGPDSLIIRSDGKVDCVYLRSLSLGQPLARALDESLEGTINSIAIAKVMTYQLADGVTSVQFARPVRGLVALHGSDVVSANLLGLNANRITEGHRFLSHGSITLKHADHYERVLRVEGRVIVDFAERRAEIVKQLNEAEGNAKFVADDALLDEITALVEAPTVYAGEFSTEFLTVPEECLILSMQQHQRYVPLRDKGAGKLLSRFLFVSNIETKQPREIIHGNERVLRARLSDAKFFFEQDRKTRLDERVQRLAKVVYHNKLGSQLERVERIKKLAGTIANELKADVKAAERAAFLCKADLLTDMVGEFPELQGVMGRYYALHDGEPKEVADAVEAHYRPRFAGDKLPESPIACAIALADKLDAIAGLFSVGQQPTGDKDPFGLRRAALGIVRIVVENKLPLSLLDLADAAFEPFSSKAPVELVKFVNDRFAGYLKDLGFSTLQVDAVLSANRIQPSLVPQQLEAVKAFQALPEAESLAAANKRVVNILKQAEAKGESFTNVESSELVEPAERALHEAIRSASERARLLFDRGDYAGYLTTFSVLKAPVDAFFDSVMVMVDDPKLRRGRLALLRDLREAMNRVADISKLAA